MRNIILQIHRHSRHRCYAIDLSRMSPSIQPRTPEASWAETCQSRSLWQVYARIFPLGLLGHGVAADIRLLRWKTVCLSL
jgi:hypothetical protein